MLQVGASSTPIQACQQPFHGQKTWTGGSSSIPQVCTVHHAIYLLNCLLHCLCKRSPKRTIMVGEWLCFACSTSAAMLNQPA